MTAGQPVSSGVGGLGIVLSPWSILRSTSTHQVKAGNSQLESNKSSDHELVTDWLAIRQSSRFGGKNRLYFRFCALEIRFQPHTECDLYMSHSAGTRALWMAGPRRFSSVSVSPCHSLGLGETDTSHEPDMTPGTTHLSLGVCLCLYVHTYLHSLCTPYIQAGNLGHVLHVNLSMWVGLDCSFFIGGSLALSH